jgi:hypothetical protein
LILMPDLRAIGALRLREDGRLWLALLRFYPV